MSADAERNGGIDETGSGAAVTAAGSGPHGADTDSAGASHAGPAPDQADHVGRVSAGLRLAISTLTIWRAGAPRVDAGAVSVAQAPDNSVVALSAGTIARFLAGRPLWLVAQRWLMGTVLAGLAVRMATEARR